MSRQVSYEEIGAVTATFIAQSGVEDGMAVKLAGDSTVGPCTAGERFCGVALAPVGALPPFRWEALPGSNTAAQASCPAG